MLTVLSLLASTTKLFSKIFGLANSKITRLK